MMRSTWAQPSLSRDFALLAAAILFIVFLISSWVTYVTYAQHTNDITEELEKEAVRINHVLLREMESANYMLTALGRQIILDPDLNQLKLAQTLKSFDSRGYLYAIFSWISRDQKITVSSNRGILDKPVDISDRDYAKKALAEPWKMHIGQPIEGRVSGRWVIPVAIGLTDYTGKFIGTIMLSLDIKRLTEQLDTLTRRDGISLAIATKTLTPLTRSTDNKNSVVNNFPTEKLINVNFDDHPSGLITKAHMLWASGSYAYYYRSPDSPYVILLTYDSYFSNHVLRSQLWVRLAELVGVGIFFVLFLWIMRARMIRPVEDMTAVAAAVAKGEHHLPLRKNGPVEIEALAIQIRRVSEYIAETKRIEDELRNKMFVLKRAKEKAEMNQRSKTEFFSHICQEMQAPLNNITGFAQVMKDQLYGPIENKKYRQYSTDIYHTGNSLLIHLQDLLTLAQVETDYVQLLEKPVIVLDAITKALQAVSDKMEAEKVSSRLKIADPLPRLVVDEFRLQQILMNLLLYALDRGLPESALLIEARLLGENKDRLYFAIIISTNEQKVPSQETLLILAERLHSHNYLGAAKPSESLKEQIDVGLELARTLIAMHHGTLDIQEMPDGTMTLVILFGASRIRFVEQE
jgi:signal transduction histidine kinase